MIQDQLKRARDALGMKQWELGVALGVSEAEVCLWEKGKRRMPERYLVSWEPSSNASNGA